MTGSKIAPSTVKGLKFCCNKDSRTKYLNFLISGICFSNVLKAIAVPFVCRSAKAIFSGNNVYSNIIESITYDITNASGSG